MAAEMTQDSILLLGANGQVGSELQSKLPKLGNVIALDFPEVDFCSEEALRAIVNRIRPTVIVNAAAYTAVDKAESEEGLARAINARAPKILAEEAAALGAIMVHYSTDYVFDGTKTSAYVETDPANPLSVYGKTKLDGEVAVRTCAKHLIFRTSWVISAHGHNFVKTMLRLAKDRNGLNIVADQWGAPTSAALLADATVLALRNTNVAPPDDMRWGLYHLVASGETTWHGLARYVISEAIRLGEILKTTPDTVMPITTAQYPTPAARPSNSRLSTEKFASMFGFTPDEWTVGVDEALRQLVGAKI
jgi:dTDP-4-dehydrorhamnose reductase